MYYILYIFVLLKAAPSVVDRSSFIAKFRYDTLYNRASQMESSEQINESAKYYLQACMEYEFADVKLIRQRLITIGLTNIPLENIRRGFECGKRKKSLSGL